ncbi:LacI family DNA-binding transcriptional regulator [Demetria terragena]|uniref:LacI family DNA-binding transcriptional regulator n=1 Tax=Demetria terragena TaxID=63959 RepID=UPI0003796F6E|nr:LacI family DNA-binding transcriptional regulator [Demetria terragena]
MPTPRKRVRLRDVADHAGVSTSTVSHVINGTRFVAPETRTAVTAAMEVLEFQAPRTAGLSGGAGGGRTVGLVVTGASNPYNGELLQGVEQEAVRNGFAVMLCDSHDDPRREADGLTTLVKHAVDAIVLAPTADWQELALPILRKHQRPFVLVDRSSEVRCDQVSTENEAVSAALVEHLTDLGHRRVAMIAGIEGISTTRDRVSGFRAALTSAGVDHEAGQVVPGHSSVAGGRAAALQLLGSGNPPTALFSGNNAMTVGILLAINELRLSIPDGIAVVAFDDFEWADAMTPGLTAVAQPFFAMGAQAVQLLMRRLTDPMAPRRTIRLPAEVVHRTSCGCPRLDCPKDRW